MLYLLDANTLIDAKRDYYPISRVPEFWEWIIFKGQQGEIKIPIEIFEEFKDTKKKDGKMDALATWACEQVVKDALVLEEVAKQDLVAKVIYEGYTSSPTDDDIKKLGRDPFLIAYALKDP